ncbi:sialidase family protein [Nesterenkonia halophila]
MTPLSDTSSLPVIAADRPDGIVRWDEGRGLCTTLIPTPRRSNHAPSILVLPDGDMLAAWFGGSDEGNQDIDILVSRYDREYAAWSAPDVVTDDRRRSDQNPGLFLTTDGEVWLLYTSQLSRQSGVPETFNLQHTSVVKRLRSVDGGRSWDGPNTMFSEEGTFARQPVQVLSDGRWLHGQWMCFDDTTRNGSDQPVIHVSDDRGASWSRTDIPQGAGRVHPNIVEVAPGRLVCLFRSRWADWVYLSRSEDHGATWSAPTATELPNNNAGLSAFTLPSGRLALVSNEEQEVADDARVRWPYERTRLVIAVSADEGRTWPVRRVLEPGDGFTGPGNRRSNRRQEYPHGLVDGTGTIHVVYACDSRRAVRHLAFTEDWIVGTDDQVHTDCKLWG